MKLLILVVLCMVRNAKINNNFDGEKLLIGFLRRLGIDIAKCKTMIDTYKQAREGRYSTELKEIMNALHDLHQDGRTIVMVTHDPEIALHTERTLHLRDGLIEKIDQNGMIRAAITEGAR